MRTRSRSFLTSIQTLVQRDPKPFVGYSDNTNLLSWLWTHGVAGFYGGSTQVQLGPGPAVDACHAASLRAALLTGERLEITDPGESEDFGKDWADPAALTEFGDRDADRAVDLGGSEPESVTGRTWGGCIEVVQWILTAGRFPVDPSVLDGGVLLLESCEELIPAQEFGWILRSLGERGLIEAVDAVLVARPPYANFEKLPVVGRTRSPPCRTARHGHRGRPPVQPRCGCLVGCRSGTRDHSGSFRTAERSPSTPNIARSGPTTDESVSGCRPRAAGARRPHDPAT